MILTLKNSCVLKIVLFACLINLFVSNEGVSQNAVLLTEVFVFTCLRSKYQTSGGI